MPQMSGANVNYSPAVHTIDRTSCWRLAQQNKQLPIISRRRINVKDYATPVEREIREITSNETEVGIYVVSICRNNFLVTTEIRLPRAEENCVLSIWVLNIVIPF
jgi:hypothetical protein